MNIYDVAFETFNEKVLGNGQAMQPIWIVGSRWLHSLKFVKNWIFSLHSKSNSKSLNTKDAMYNG